MNRRLVEMFEIEQKLGVANKNWLMSTREKLGLIGLLHCMNPCTVLELGYHRGGTTQWITRFAKKVITVDVNEFVSLAPDNTQISKLGIAPLLMPSTESKKRNSTLT